MEPRRILIVDDERLIADTFAIILAQNSYVATPAYSGEEALILAKRGSFDVALIDVVMPGMDGFETARQLQAILPHCQMILLSECGAIAGEFEQGFDVLAKPIHPEYLLQRLRKLPY